MSGTAATVVCLLQPYATYNGNGSSSTKQGVTDKRVWGSGVQSSAEENDGVRSGSRYHARGVSGHCVWQGSTTAANNKCGAAHNLARSKIQPRA